MGGGELAALEVMEIQHKALLYWWESKIILLK